MSQNLSSRELYCGKLTRYVKPSLLSELSILASAFDLRDGEPPEIYVSFFKVAATSKQAMLTEGFQIIATRMRSGLRKNGAILLLDIEECLQEVNDEDEDLIAFRPAGLPHCGLYYLTDDLSKRQEIKTTLAFLATDNYLRISQLEVEI